VPVVELSTAGVLWVCGVCRIWGQSGEGRGSPEDEKGRHPSCAELIVTNEYKERGAIAPLKYTLHCNGFLTVTAELML
jgi:hypothetical protein